MIFDRIPFSQFEDLLGKPKINLKAESGKQQRLSRLKTKSKALEKFSV